MPLPRVYAVSDGPDVFSAGDVELIDERGLCATMTGLSEISFGEPDPEPTDSASTDWDAEQPFPARDFDLYYARNQSDAFARLPSPKVTFAYPYDATAFETADAILTTSDIWREGLAAYNDAAEWREFFGDCYPEKIVPPKKIVNIGQPMTPDFYDHRDSFRHFRYRARFGYGFTIGYLDNRPGPPPEFFEILPSLEKEIPFLSTVLIGNCPVTDTSPSLRRARNIPRDDLPFAISACDVIVGGEPEEANWQSSPTVQLTMACGVPILTKRRTARVEQLGDLYPNYYQDSNELSDLIMKLFREDGYRCLVEDFLLDRREKFAVDSYSNRLAALLEEVMGGE